jgi:glycerol uptake facilitator-like aquaporin
LRYRSRWTFAEYHQYQWSNSNSWCSTKYSSIKWNSDTVSVVLELLPLYQIHGCRWNSKFSIYISDGNGGTATATETITITNNDPIAVNDNYSTPANTPIWLNPLSWDTDPDGHSLSITSINGVTLTPGVAQSIAVSSGTVLVSSTGLITFVPSTGFVGIVSFPYIISDGNGGTATATETITITNNDPIAVNDNYSTPANTPIWLNPLSWDTDPDGHSLSITSINGVTLTPGVAQSIAVSSGTVLVSSTGLITFVPSTGFVGIVSFPYIISDGNGGTTTATETITITNNDPIALDDSATTPANIPVVLNLLGNDTDPDGHTLSITSINGVTLTSGVAQSILVPNGIVTVSSTGVVTFIPDPLYTGPTGFPYTISDGNGGTDTANVSIDVLNTDPVAVDNYYTWAVGANILLQPLVNDSDVDGHNLNITDINGVTLTPGVAQSIPVTGWVVTIDIAGNITFTPNPWFTWGVAIPYSISDGHGGSDNATIFINYPNNPPVASNDTWSTIAGTPIIISPLGNDTDPDGNPLTITEINGVPVIPGSTVTIPWWTATLNPDGTITFTPNPGFTGDVVIPYTISDGNGGTDTATISISVTSDPIAANDDNYTTQTNTPVVINLLNNDVSPLGDDLTITSINGITLTPGIAQSIPVTGWIVNISPAGITTFVPDTGFAWVVTFPYSIIDEFGNTDTALVTITVENTPPVANNDIISTLVNTPVIIYPLTNDSDPDGNPLTITEINGVPVTSGTTVVVTGWTATLNPDGTITFTPNPWFTGDVVIPYTISDGNGGTDTAVITVTVETAPLAANPDLYTSNPNQNIDLNILANDVSSWTITITDINGVTLTPGVAQTIPVSWWVVNVSSTGLIAFTPDPWFVGPVSFPYTITDTLGNTDDTTVQINILNSDPIALDDSATTPANIPVVLNLLDNDTDPDGHTLSITSINGVTLTSGVALSILVPNGIVTVSSTGVITFIPDPLYTGPTGFPYTISDGNGGTDTANVSIDVLNTDPVAVDNYYTWAVGANILLQPLVNDSDVDGHNLNITDINGVTLTPGIAQTIPVTGWVVTIDIAGNITFTPNPWFTWGVAIPYSISDGHGGSDNATIFINYPNNPPVASNDTWSTIAGTPIIISPLGNDTDPDGNPLTITEINGVPVIPGSTVTIPWWTATLNPDGTITFTPNPGFTGDVVIPYTISDGNGGTDTATISISVTSDPIAANDDNYTTQTNTPVVINLLNNDVSPLGDDLTITSINGITLTPGIAQSIPVTGWIVNISPAGITTFVPDTGFAWVVTFPYSIIDEFGNTDTALVTITVENTPPVANNDIISTLVNTPVIIYPLTNDSDPDGNPLTITEINGVPVTSGTTVVVTGWTTTLNPDGTITFTPNPWFTGDVVIPYTISDGNGGTNTAVITVTVETAPLAANPDLYTSNPNQNIDLNILANDVSSWTITITDINGVTLTPGVAQTIPVSWWVVNVSSTGLIAFTPNPWFVGPISFPYTITDTLGNTDDTTVQINILNSDPIALDDSATTPANIPVVLNLLDNDTDPDGHTLSITSINGVTLTSGVALSILVPNGIVTVSSTGVITFIPDPLYTGPTGFPYTISDGNGGTDTANVSIDVLNTDPVAVDNYYTWAVGANILLQPLVNDSDVDGHNLNITDINGVTLTPGIAQTIPVTGWVVTIDIAGNITFTPNPWFTWGVAIPYSISDGHGGSDNATIFINYPNNPPVASNDTWSTIAGTPIIISPLGNDTDPDGNPLTITEINGVPVIPGSTVTIPWWTATLNPDGTITFTPNPGFTGDVVIPYTISDGNGGTDTAIISISVTSDPIAANDDNYTTQTNTPVVINLLNNDVSPLGDDLTITSINGITLTPGIAQSIPVTGWIVNISPAGITTFVPDTGFAWVVTFPYSIIDEFGNTDTALVTITVENTPPVANNDIISTLVNTPVIIYPLTNDSDPDGNPLTITEINGVPVTSGTTVVVTGWTTTLNPDGTITFTPNPWFTGDVVIPYTISDGNGGTNTAVITVTVETAPLAANPDLYTSNPNQNIDLNILANDVSSWTITITDINGVTLTPGVAQTIPVSWWVVNVSSTGLIAFTPNPWFVGPISFPYTITDTLGNTDDTTVQINILNSDPIALDDSATTPANIPVVLNLLDNDTDPDGHTLSITSINGVTLTSGVALSILVPNGIVTVSSTGVITFIPDPLYTGPTGFPYTISDGNGGTDTANVSIDVLNTDPVAVDNYYTWAVGANILLQPLVNDSDVDGHNLNITDINGVTLTPGIAQTIPVTGWVVTIDIAGNITFTPNPWFTWGVAIPYSISDGHGGSDNATIFINYPNNPPVASNDTWSTIAGTPIIISPLGNDTDPDGNPLTITEINGVPVIPGSTVTIPWWTATLNPDGTITFTPNPGFTGDVVIPYTISDGNGGTDTAIISISVTSDPIAANDDNYTTQTNTPVVINLLNNDVSPLGDDLTITSINGITLTPGIAQSIPVTGWIVNISPAGITTFVPDTGFAWVVTFPYSIIDEFGNTDTALVTITVENTPPVANNDIISTLVNTPVIIYPLTNDSDPDGNPLTITEINGVPVTSGTTVVVTGWTATLNPDGTITFTPNPWFTGDVVIPYTISDGNGGTNTTVITVTVETAPLAANPDLYTSNPNQNIDLNILANDVSSWTITITDINGVTLTPGVAQTIPVSWWVVNVSSTGLIAFSPDPWFVGPVSFPYTITDTLGNTDDTTVQINILNSDPIALDGSATTPANIPVVLNLLGNDTDPDGHTLSITSINGVTLTSGVALSILVPNGIVTVSSTGVITFIPDPLYTGPTGFPYTISDGNGGTDTANVSIDVLNTDPVANPNVYSGVTNTQFIINPLSNDIDADNHSLSIVYINNNPITINQTIYVTWWKVILQSGWLLLFQSDSNYLGHVNFQYTINDGHGWQSTANIKVIISWDMWTSFSAKQSIENIPTPVNQTIETTKVKIEQITKILELSEQTHAVASNPDVTTINIGVTKILPKTGADY